MDLKGVIPAVITPFDEKEEVDYDKLKNFLDFVIERGVHGIYLLGTNGEAPLLSLKERKKVIRTAADHLEDSNIPLIAGTMANSTSKTVELSRFAENHGADAVHVITPYYYPTEKDDLKRHFQTVANNIDISIMIYSIPQLTGHKLEIKELKELAEIENIIGIKDSSQDVSWMAKAMSEIENFTFLSGADDLILPYISMGVDGCVTGVGNAFPEMVVELYDDISDGNLQAARKDHHEVLEVKKVMDDFPYMSAVKGALKLRGKDFGPLRSPLHTLNEEELQELRTGLEDAGVL